VKIVFYRKLNTYGIYILTTIILSVVVRALFLIG